MNFIMFTKHLEGCSLREIVNVLKRVGVNGADLCVREGYPVNPQNITRALPEAVELLTEEGLSIPLVTAPGNFNTTQLDYAERYYQACGENGVKHIKLGYWHWRQGTDYWKEVDRIRTELELFEKLSEKTGVQTVVHNHSGHSIGLNSSSVMHIVNGFNPKHIGVFADVGHLSICGEPIDMALNIVQKYLAVISFKDLMRVPTIEGGEKRWGVDVVRLGTGFGDWNTTLRTLKAQIFEGTVSMHSEYSDEPVETVIDLARTDVRFIRNLLDHL